ncbi:hypothetical protein B0H17DRAFT_1124668 [Mycena rosella]|uniref:Uncharacterized protein n=1 Tax=Mycena rosella TaxID=1033263 RepID=A0AAD7MAZ3_MYCRO|nr:hypothetical protein B0H17DRAFT_1124668 [Mycena rosella]
MPSNTKFLGRLQLTEEDKRLRHGDAQKRYVDRNLASVQEKARARMAARRACVVLSPEATNLVAEHRREINKDYRERKFLEKYGTRAFKKHYLPLYESTPGMVFTWTNEETHVLETRAAKRLCKRTQEAGSNGDAPAKAKKVCKEAGLDGDVPAKGQKACKVTKLTRRPS